MKEKTEDQKLEKKLKELRQQNKNLTVATIALTIAFVLSTASGITGAVLLTNSHKAEIKHMDELEKGRLSELNNKYLSIMEENKQLKKDMARIEVENQSLKKHTEQLETLNQQQQEMYQSDSSMRLESIEEYVLQASRRMVVPIVVPENPGLSRITAQVKSGNKLDFYLMTDEENAEKFKGYQIISMISSANKTYSYEITDLLPAGTYYLGVADGSWGILSDSHTTYTVSLYNNHDPNITQEEYTGECDY